LAPAKVTFEGFKVTGYVMGGPVYQLLYTDTLTIPSGQLYLSDSTDYSRRLAWRASPPHCPSGSEI